MTAILGLSAFFHDSAAALIADGRIIAAAQEERFSRIKHDEGFPTCAIKYCLEEAGLTEEQIDFVGFYEKPLLKFDRLLETYLSYAPVGFVSFRKAMPNWIAEKLRIRRLIKQGLNRKYRRRIVFCSHHEAHAASAFYPSPFDQAAILTMDGVGEWSTSTMGIGRHDQIKLIQQTRFPHSLGLLYSAFTHYCGFRVNSGEYKLMGLAPYGQPRYVDLIKDRLVKIHDDGSFRLNLDYFGFCQTLRMTTPKLHRLLGRGPRERDSQIEALDKDLAASIQTVTEEIVLKAATELHRITGLDKLCMAGGVALNCVANGRLLRESPFEKIWVQPAAGDAGGALGVAFLIWHQLLKKARPYEPSSTGVDFQNGSLLGPSYSAKSIAELLQGRGQAFRQFDDEDLLHHHIAKLLAEGKVVGRFAGRAEFGPRALGNRSILGDPRVAEMQSTMNMKIKFRESFRPFAPAVLASEAHRFFDLSEDTTSPYMLMVCNVKTDSLPATTHVDGSARVQTVNDVDNPSFAKLLKTFHQTTGCPVLINTSFNVRGEPIVGSPEDALRCFQNTEMDAVVLENCVIEK
ncbi:carbamoyltransferase [Stieleria sp. JC731]|uniref:carbamoyltransferase family protein n=1 Tax=Pirellulaceae TaxID=2691357 RepID=UPI001E65B055|nr:carbamoyltransferase [Stieleria sp. JC731]MCC9599986.1 carbamoyltransferase [Stieleria sp. JC731]